MLYRLSHQGSPYVSQHNYKLLLKVHLPMQDDAGDVGSIPGLERSPEEEIATYSSSLAWRIPWTKEPGRLQTMGLQRVGHD